MAEKSPRKAGRPPKYPKAAGQERSMVRVQISLSPALYEALEAFRNKHKFPPERSLVIEKVLEDFLAQEGHFPPVNRKET